MKSLQGGFKLLAATAHKAAGRFNVYPASCRNQETCFVCQMVIDPDSARPDKPPCLIQIRGQCLLHQELIQPFFTGQNDYSLFKRSCA